MLLFVFFTLKISFIKKIKIKSVLITSITILLFYQIGSSLWEELSRKTSLLVISEILELFVNTSTGDDKYSVCSRKKLSQPLQMQLSKKQKFFSQFFANDWNLRYILNILKKKDEPHRWCVFEVTDCEKPGYLNI